MCGIFGSPTITPSVRRMLPYLGIEMQTRGRDAWGASDGDVVIKRKGPIVETWAESEAGFAGWHAGIFHTRGASYGTPKEEENAHPFSFTKPDGSTVIGIHNGVVSNKSELDTKYQRACAVDSEHLWMHRAAGIPWTDICGWGNLAWWETAEGQRRMSLLRFNTDSLKIARLQDGEFVFCSEVKPIATIAQMLGNPAEVWITVEAEHHYWFQDDPAADSGVTLWKGSKLEFGRPQPVAVVAYTPSGYGYPGGHRSTWKTAMGTCCQKCNTVRVKDDDETLCYSCLSGLLEQFKKEEMETWMT